MSPFFTLQRQLSFEPERRLPVAVVAGTPPDPQKAREKLVIQSLHTKLPYYRKQAFSAPQFLQNRFCGQLAGPSTHFAHRRREAADGGDHD